MKDFSLYEYAIEIASSTAEDMGEVTHVSRRDFDERATFIFRAQVPCLEYISLLIENAVLLRMNRAGRVYAGFEKLSRMEAVADRYLRMADLSERIYVFGEADWQPPRHPHLRVVGIDERSKLAREWLVIADSPSMHVALVAQEQVDSGAPTLEARSFHAVKTSDHALVGQLAAAAENVIDSFMNNS